MKKTSSSKIKIQPFKSTLADSLIISGTIIVTLVSAFYQTMLINAGTTLEFEGPYILSVVDILVVTATNVLALVWKRKTVSAFNSVFHFITSLSSVIIFLAGRIDVFSSTGLNRFLMICYVPTQAYAAIGYGTYAPIIISVLLFASSVIFLAFSMRNTAK